MKHFIFYGHQGKWVKDYAQLTLNDCVKFYDNPLNISGNFLAWTEAVNHPSP